MNFRVQELGALVNCASQGRNSERYLFIIYTNYPPLKLYSQLALLSQFSDLLKHSVVCSSSLKLPGARKTHYSCLVLMLVLPLENCGSTLGSSRATGSLTTNCCYYVSLQTLELWLVKISMYSCSHLRNSNDKFHGMLLSALLKYEILEGEKCLTAD